MKRKRIEQAVQVIKHAIDKGISVKEASSQCGYSSTYVKNVKAQVIDKFDNGIITKEDYDFFMSNYDLYEGSKKTNVKVTPKTMVDEKPASVPKGVLVGESIKKEEIGDDMTITWAGDSKKFYATEESTEVPEVPYDSSDWSEAEENNTYGHEGYPDGHIKTLDQLLARTGVDLKEWNVARQIVNKWDVTSWKQGFPQTWENFQVKATLERIPFVKESKDFVSRVKDLMENYEPPVVSIDAIPLTKNSSDVEENNLLEVSLFDLHMGKLGWAGEVGENFDTKIARARFLDAVNGLLARAKAFEYDQILFPIGNDFFNSDNQFNTTTKGTEQDEDLRWQKTWDLGWELIVDAIMILKATGRPIHVPVIPGNHDQERSKYLGTVVDVFFRNDDQVTVDNGAETRKFIEWGEVMLGFTHGNEEKENSLPMLMATEAKEMWGRTTFHEWHLGHFHKKRNVKFTVLDKAQMTNEEHSIIVRYLSSLTGAEEWHYKKGYIGTQKAGEAFIWNDKCGMIGNLNFTFTDFSREA